MNKFVVALALLASMVLSHGSARAMDFDDDFNYDGYIARCPGDVCRSGSPISLTVRAVPEIQIDGNLEESGSVNIQAFGQRGDLLHTGVTRGYPMRGDTRLVSVLISGKATRYIPRWKSSQLEVWMVVNGPMSESPSWRRFWVEINPIPKCWIWGYQPVPGTGQPAEVYWGSTTNAVEFVTDVFGDLPTNGSFTTEPLSSDLTINATVVDEYGRMNECSGYICVEDATGTHCPRKG